MDPDLFLITSDSNLAKRKRRFQLVFWLAVSGFVLGLLTVLLGIGSAFGEPVFEVVRWVIGGCGFVACYAAFGYFKTPRHGDVLHDPEQY